MKINSKIKIEVHCETAASTFDEVLAIYTVICEKISGRCWIVRNFGLLSELIGSYPEGVIVASVYQEKNIKNR